MNLTSLQKYHQLALDVFTLGQAFIRRPSESLRTLRPLADMVAGALRARAWPQETPDQLAERHRPGSENNDNSLVDYFEKHRTGRGILKWLHYFDIYHRYFQKFVGREVHVLEIGVFSGGSLDMWKSYFGPKCRMYAVDIQAACKVYEDDRTKVFIGDQADRGFWKRLRESVPRIDIVIDDGGHLSEQQIVTLEEILPYMPPGGVFLCEDIHGIHHKFVAYLYGLADRLNEYDYIPNADASAIEPTRFQRSIHAVHLYPYVAVIEKTDRLVEGFLCPRHGTEWQPFL